MRRGVISETVYRVESSQEGRIPLDNLSRSLTPPFFTYSRPIPRCLVGAEKGIRYQLSKIKVQLSFFREKKKSEREISGILCISNSNNALKNAIINFFFCAYTEITNLLKYLKILLDIIKLIALKLITLKLIMLDHPNNYIERSS